MTYAFGFIAGALSILSPCVLPMAPIVLAGAAQRHKLAPLALMTGIVLSFLSSTFLIAIFGFSMNIDRSTMRNSAAVLMAVAGIFLISPYLYNQFVAFAEPAFSRFTKYTQKFQKPGHGGFAGQFILGLLIGIIWSPCAGPTLGAAAGLVMQKENLGQASLVMMAFSIGAVLPLLLISYAGQYFMGKKKNLSKSAFIVKPLLGTSLILVAFLIISGWEKNLETFLTKIMPDWLVDITTRF
jgi:cytochrome c biogenesis protein CcdA